MEENKCHYCGERIKIRNQHQRSDKRFHDDNCRQAYHVEKKLINRAISRIVKGIATLSTVRDSPSLNRVFASAHLDDVNFSMQHTFGTRWRCWHCENETTSQALPKRKCTKCNSKMYINLSPQIT